MCATNNRCLRIIFHGVALYSTRDLGEFMRMVLEFVF